MKDVEQECMYGERVEVDTILSCLRKDLFLYQEIYCYLLTYIGQQC